MAQEPRDNPRMAGPIEYASAQGFRRSSPVTVVAIISICVAVLSLLFNGLLLRITITRLYRAQSLQGQMQQMIAARNQKMAQLSAGNPATHPFQARALNSKEISRVMDFIGKQLGADVGGESLTIAQELTLTRLLSQDGQQLIDPNTPLVTQRGPQTQSAFARMDRDHVLSLDIFHGRFFNQIHINPDGKESHVTTPTTPTPFSTPAPPPLTAQNQKILHNQYAAAWASIAIYSINLLLAILLIFGAIYLLRRNPRGIHLHWIYVVCKPLICILASTEIFTSYFGIENSLQFPLDTSVTLLGCFYPLVLLIFLRSRTFRGNARGGTPGYLSFAADDQRPPLFTAIATASICIGCLSLLVGGFFETVAITAIVQSHQDRADEQLEVATEAQQEAMAARAAAVRPPPRTLRKDEIQQFISAIQGQLQNGPHPASLTKPQADAIAGLLSTPGQQLVDPDIPREIAFPTDYQNIQAFIDNHNNLILNMTHQSSTGNIFYSIQLDPAGKTVGTPQIKLPSNSAAPMPTILAPNRQQYYESQIMSDWFAVIAFACDFIPAIMLLVGARQLLKSNPRGIRTHWLYSGIKFLTTVLGSIAIGAMVMNWNDSSNMSGMAIVLISLAPGLFALIYPTILLTLLRSAKFQAKVYEVPAL